MAASDVVQWYLSSDYRRGPQPGSAAMFCDPALVGAFAARPEALASGCPEALFRVLITSVMFQRQRDVQVQRILRGISPAKAAELCDARGLQRSAARCRCSLTRSTSTLYALCDLAKDTQGTPVCTASPTTACHLKRHALLLRRYGDFGKIPTAAALVMAERGVVDLSGLLAAVVAAEPSPARRAIEIEQQLSGMWRVSKKIACLFLSAVSNPELSPGHAPWSEALDWTHFVVIDSNVDTFLQRVGYRGPPDYDSRRTFVQALSASIDLATLGGLAHGYNPRIVQQALYLFESVSNRRAAAHDCMHRAPAGCSGCLRSLRRLCPAGAS